METADDFLRDIAGYELGERVVHPNDDARRLIYADWLDENGEADFARFIRLQCELARRPEEDEEWLERKIEEEALWPRLVDRWYDLLRGLYFIDPFAERKGPLDLSRVRLRPANFRRGLLESAGITVDPGRYAAESPRWVFLLWAHHFTAGGAMSDDFFGCPRLWRVRGMNCERCGVRDSSLQGFAGAEHFHALESLDFFRNYIGPVGIAAFIRCPSLTSLTHLDLTENKLGDAGVEALVSSPVCRKLERLSLVDNGITDAGARALAASPHLPALRELILGSSNRISPAAARAITDALPNLRTLDYEPPEGEEDDES
jgi:uncharacterized protein (TIGR02996 family)